MTATLRPPASCAATMPQASSSATMRAAVQHSHGGPEVLRIEQVAVPVPGPHDVLVEVHACALNRLDVLQRVGPKVLPSFTMPHIAGMDIAGRIAAFGDRVDPDASGLSVGAPVVVDPVVTCADCPLRSRRHENHCSNLRTIGSTRPGGYAEFVVVPARNVHTLDDDTDLITASAVPVVYATAWHGLIGVGAIVAGETLLVHAAGSGMSIAAIQIAKSRGVRVIGTVGSAAKVEQARAIGADHVLVNREPGWLDAVLDLTDGAGVDMVYDHVGPALFQDSIHALRIDGRMVFCGTTTGNDTTITLTSVYHAGRSLLGAGAYHPEEFAATIDAFRAGAIAPVIDSVSPLDAVGDAQERMLSSDFFGKLVLAVR